jgi:hypothetical protein
VVWEDVEVPAISRVWVPWISFYCREAAAVGGRMDICPILDLDSLRDALNESPEFTLDVVLTDRFLLSSNGVKGHLVRKMTFFEVLRFLLELPQRIHAAFFESKLSSSDKTSRTVPVIFWNTFDLRLQAVAVISCVTAVAEEDVGRIVIGAALFAPVARTLVCCSRTRLVRVWGRLSRLRHVRTRYSGRGFCKFVVSSARQSNEIKGAQSNRAWIETRMRGYTTLFQRRSETGCSRVACSEPTYLA